MSASAHLEKNHTILIVDDDPICLRVLQAHLQDAGYKTILAGNGREAWEKLTGSHINFSVILADRVMLDIDGIELLKKVKASPALRHIPVIMVTGEADRKEVIDAVKFGVFDFVYKPLDSEILLPLVARAISHVDA